MSGVSGFPEPVPLASPSLGSRGLWPWFLVSGAECRRPRGPVNRFSPTDLVTDLDFSPFDDFLLATGSADRTVSGATCSRPGPSSAFWVTGSQPPDPRTPLPLLMTLTLCSVEGDSGAPIPAPTIPALCLRTHSLCRPGVGTALTGVPWPQADSPSFCR